MSTPRETIFEEIIVTLNSLDSLTSTVDVRWRDRIALLLILLVAAGIRSYGLGSKSLWFDEALSWRLAQFPIPELIERTARVEAVHPPCYFLLLRTWISIAGNSEVAMRCLGVLAGVGSVAGMFAFVWNLLRFRNCHEEDNRRALDSAAWSALLAAALVALSALHIHASKQVRGYSLGSAFLLWGSWALLQAIHAKQRAALWWMLHMALALGLCYTHHFGILAIAAQALFVAMYCIGHRYTAQRCYVLGAYAVRPASDDTYRCASSLLAFVVIGVAYLPWLQTTLRQVQSVRSSHIAVMVPQDIPNSIITSLLSTWAVPVHLEPTIAWSAVLLLLSLIVCVGLRCGWPGMYLLVSSLLPVVVAIGFSMTSSRRVVTARYLTFVQLYWLASFAVAIGLIRFRVERVLLTSLVLMMAVYSCNNAWDIIGPSARPGMRAATAYVLSQRAVDEPLIARTPYVLFGASYYARDSARPVLCIAESYPRFRHGSSQLDVDDLIPPSLLEHLPTGAWLLSTESYEDTAGFVVPLPTTWRLERKLEFDQDYIWEMPIVVEHYVRENPARSSAGATP